MTEHGPEAPVRMFGCPACMESLQRLPLRREQGTLVTERSATLG